MDGLARLFMAQPLELVMTLDHEGLTERRVLFGSRCCIVMQSVMQLPIQRQAALRANVAKHDLHCIARMEQELHRSQQQRWQ